MAVREALLAERANGWERVARDIGHPEFRIEWVRDHTVGYTYQVCVPPGRTIDALPPLAPMIAAALGLRSERVTVTLDRDSRRRAYVHIRENDAGSQAGERG